MVRGGAPFGKGDGGIRKIPSLMGKSDASERNESSLSNCRVQLALSTRKDGMILEILLLILSETDIIYLIIWAIGYMKRMMISSHWICMQSHFDNHVM